VDALVAELTVLRDGLAAAGVAEGENVVAAVSGGGDSTALLELLVAARRPGGLVVAHHDHRARADSDRDATLVAEQAARHGLRLLATRSANVGPRPEAVLRQERYDALAAGALSCGGLLVTGHTLDDQAETVLAQLVRGAGPRGARGIARRRSWQVPGRDATVAVIRPLLGSRRADLRQVLSELARPWFEDPTNSTDENLRGRLRREVLPALAAAAGRDPAPALARFAAAQGELVDFLDDCLPPHLDRAELAALPDALLTHWLRGQGIASGPHLAWAVAAIRGDQPRVGRDLPGGLRLEIDAAAVAVRPAPAVPVLPSPPAVYIQLRPSLPEPVPRGCCFLAPDRTPLPLAVRFRRDGDRFRPLDGPGSRLLADFLADAGVPRAERDRVPVVVTRDGDIAWVAPWRVDDRFAARPGDGPVLQVTLSGGGETT
jgi:tRNA(Ile)-lysidine synthase